MPFDSTNFEPQDRALDALRALRAFHSDPARWCSSGHQGDDGSHCIISAVAAAAGAYVYDTVKPYLLRALPPGAGTLVRFNELMGTTHAELMAFYDRAIELRRAEVVQAVS